MAEANVLNNLKSKVRTLKQELYVLYLAYRDSRVPWYAKLFVICVVAYAFSPIDLIPDFIPVLGYLDDLIIVPLGITLALKLIPKSVLEDCRAKANEIKQQGKPKNYIMAMVFVLIWILLAVWIGSYALKIFS